MRARYKIARVLSSTRLRNIYIAEDQHLRGRHWVIRQMQPVGIDSNDRNWLVGQFEAEARLLSTLEHPNLPKLIDFFVQDTHLYVIREFVPGLDLAAILKQRGGRLAERDALHVGQQLCDLMTYLLKKKLPPIVFRELSLDNLVFTPEGQVKLIDFGFSRLFQREARLGSPNYAAPEQFTQESEVDGRTLVYNVGALVYHLVTGHNPGSTPFDLPAPDALNPQLSERSCKVLEKATENESRSRYGSLAELSKGLLQAMNAKSQPRAAAARPTRAAQRPSSGHLRTPQGGSATVRVAVKQGAKSGSSPLTAWMFGLMLTLVMGGTLLAIYFYILKPGGL